MSQRFDIHPENPQMSLIEQAVEIIRAGGVVAYPTDSAYALGWQLGNKDALARVCRIRALETDHNFALACRDLSELATYAKFGNSVFRLLKANTPGPYTFILSATREVPRRLQHPKKKTVGFRVPDNPISQALLGALDEPLMTTTLIMPGEEEPLTDPVIIRERLERVIDLLIDGGMGGTVPTTVVDLQDDVPVVLRVGKGDPAPFE